MKNRLTLKLFLIFSLTISVIVIAMLLLTRWSFQRGFTDYLNQLDQTQVVEVIERLESYYQDNGSWQGLRDSRHLWRDLSRSGSAELSDETTAAFPRRNAMRQDLLSGRPPPRRGANNGPNALDIGPRLNLFDAHQGHIIGRNNNIDDLTLHALKVEAETVGWLGIAALRAPKAIRDIQFVKRQAGNLYLIGAAVITLSALVAFLLAWRLLIPIKAIAIAARTLSEGNYDTEVPVKSRDELGQLAVDFNHLAITLADNEKIRQRWIAGISHELRTPLAVLLGEIEAMQDGVRACDDQSLISLHSEASQLNKLVNDLYQLSLYDLGGLDYQIGRINLIDVIEQVVDSYQARFATAGLEIIFQSDYPIYVLADAERLAQLFHNLLENSLRYTDSGGSVMISCSEKADHALVEIDDSAPAVSEQALPKLFERLYREEGSRNRARGGAGLGLAIVQNIINAHQGSIQASLSNMGGIKISMTLPLGAR